MSGRGKSKASLALVAAAYTICEETQPISLRGICYRLFVMERIVSMTKGCTDAVSRLLVWAREQGIIPWEWIVDDSRRPERVASWDNPEAIVRAAVRGYRKNYWNDQPTRIEVISEKATIKGILAPTLNEFGVPLHIMHGYGSATAVHDIAEDSISSNKPLIMIYVGDWDPSGLHMSEVDLPRRLERYEGEVEIVRVALNDSDVARGTELPSFEVESKSKDPRYRWFVSEYGRQCWELDALSPVVLRERVESSINSYLDIDAWNHAVDVEAVERESMKSILTSWKSISGQASKYSGDQP